MEDIIEIFKEKKLKLTPQRLSVYKYLLSTKEHPSAETIYKAIHVDSPTISLATVYKAVNTLVNIGLIQELNVGEGNFRYDANANIHLHIQCVKCGKVEDLDGYSLDYINNEAKEYSGYDVLYNKVYFYGVCTKRKKRPL